MSEIRDQLEEVIQNPGDPEQTLALLIEAVLRHDARLDAVDREVSELDTRTTSSIVFGGD